MKKFLVFVLVLGLATVVTADPTNTNKLFQLSVDGVIVDEYSGISGLGMEFSETFVLDVQIAAGHWSDAMDLDLEIIGNGHIELGPETGGIPAEIIVPFALGGYEDWSHAVNGFGPTGIGEMIGASMGETRGKVVDYIVFHCDGPGDVIISLTYVDYSTIDGAQIGAGDLGSIVIHQVPEPMTLTLLGLGSLLLARRKK